MLGIPEWTECGIALYATIYFSMIYKKSQYCDSINILDFSLDKVKRLGWVGTHA